MNAELKLHFLTSFLTELIGKISFSFDGSTYCQLMRLVVLITRHYFLSQLDEYLLTYGLVSDSGNGCEFY